MSRILLIEDNRDLALGVRVNLEERRYEVQTASTLADGLTRLRQFRPHLLILDLSLPDGDGMDVVRRLRASGDSTLVLVLTARAQQTAKVQGLRVGADDYVTKPFDLEELLVRVDVLLRRARDTESTPEPAVPAMLSAGDLVIDTRARTVRRDGRLIELSRIGFDLLATLVRRRGSVVSRAELMREVWGYGDGVSSRTLDTHIFELRRLIEPDPAAPTRIRTVWRIGYRFE
jgi:DNA-binding response OmpR family regulator